MKNPYGLGPILFPLEQPDFRWVREAVLTFHDAGSFATRPCLQKYGLDMPWKVVNEEGSYLSFDLEWLSQILQLYGMYPPLEPHQVFRIRKVSRFNDQIEVVGDVLEML